MIFSVFVKISLKWCVNKMCRLLSISCWYFVMVNVLKKVCVLIFVWLCSISKCGFLVMVVCRFMVWWKMWRWLKFFVFRFGSGFIIKKCWVMVNWWLKFCFVRCWVKRWKLLLVNWVKNVFFRGVLTMLYVWWNRLLFSMS